MLYEMLSYGFSSEGKEIKHLNCFHFVYLCLYAIYLGFIIITIFIFIVLCVTFIRILIRL